MHDENSSASDMVLVFPPRAPQGSEDSAAFPVLRRRGDSVEAGVLRELESGKPIHGEVVRLERRTEHPLLFNVETVTALRPRRAAVPPRSPPRSIAPTGTRSSTAAATQLKR